MDLAHFYHIGADGGWAGPARYHSEAVRAAGLDCPVTAGITGEPAEMAAVVGWLADNWPEAQAVPCGPGFEQPTLGLARDWAIGHPGGGVLYAHTKGAVSDTPFNQAWRESMTADVVTRWQYCVAMLAGGCDIAAPHWLDPAAFPGMIYATQAAGGSTTPYPGGNFWWARAGWLAELAAPDPAGTPWDAERWIGRGKWPRVYDLRPGWPGVMLFDSPTARQILSERGTE